MPAPAQLTDRPPGQPALRRRRRAARSRSTPAGSTCATSSPTRETRRWSGSGRTSRLAPWRAPPWRCSCARQPRRSPDDGLVAESATYSVLQAGPEFASWRAAHPPRTDARRRGPRVRIERDGGVLVVTLTRPERLNALDAQMRDELSEALALGRARPRRGPGRAARRGAGVLCRGRPGRVRLPCRSGDGPPGAAPAQRGPGPGAAGQAAWRPTCTARPSGPGWSSRRSPTRFSPRPTRGSPFPRWGWDSCRAREAR